jgi:hypothetical protein
VRLISTAVLLGMLLGGCGAERGSEGADAAPDGAPEMIDSLDSADTVAGPPRPSTADSAGPAAALEVIHDYYGAIEGKDFARAYRYWGNGGEASGQTLDQLSAGFAETESVSVQTGLPGRIDPGAGQRYIEIPAAVRANTTGGGSQCFRGAYVLRRSEVDGATAEQRSWRIASADLELERAELCDAGVALGASIADTVAALVGAFGRQLASVSLLAPPDVLSREMRGQYSSFVSTALLDAWLAQPSDAPGRRVSSPWPARIDVLAVEPPEEGGYEVVGEVVYLTSEELARGGSASREPVQLHVVREGGGLRIASYQVR